MSGDSTEPELSVVVSVAGGRDSLLRCLEGLAAQEDAPSFEIVLPYDDSIADVADAAAGFARVRLVPMGHCATARPPRTPTGQHELIDRRRSAGLAAARAALVALLEDRVVPHPDWARNMVEAARAGAGVVGGAVQCTAASPLARAICLCDYSRYQPPFEGGRRAYVTDVNVCYSRELLEGTRDAWEERYHETTLHWALERKGATLWLDPRPVVDHHGEGKPLRAVLRERLEFGRLFASTRARESSVARRAVLAALAPLLPAVLFARLVRQAARRRSLRELAGAAPFVGTLLVAWSAGEMMGYITGRQG